MRNVLIVLVLWSLFGCGPADTEPATTFRVDMTDPIEQGWFDPSSETVGVRGSVTPLSWGETATASDDDGDGVYELAVPFATDDPIQYKFKVDGTDNPNEGWETGRNLRLETAFGTSQAVNHVFDEPRGPLASTRTGDIRHHTDFASSHVRGVRGLWVYLPPGYESETDRAYPVLYLHDGQNVFDIAAAGDEWRMDESAQALIAANEIEPVIIVGIENTADRITEYTPTAAQFDPAQPKAGGGGPAYGRFLTEEVKPFIDAAYRTLPSRESTAVGGSSLGGLISMHLGLAYPEVFGHLLVVSPSVFWDGREIIREVEQIETIQRPRIWLDIGTDEGTSAVDGARILRDALIARGWTLGDDLVYIEDSGAAHTEAAWAGRAEGMLRFLYAID